MCTSLLYSDLAGSVYAGRTLELQFELPYLAAFLPKGTPLVSRTSKHAPVEYSCKYDVFGIAVPNGDVQDLKFVEGLNGAGLNFSMLAFADTHGAADSFAEKDAVLSAIDLGSWMLAQFSSVDEIKDGLKTQPVLLEALAVLADNIPPFHYTVHDRSGASLIIEFFDGAMHIFDNPLGVMTNAPHFDWHRTNLNNYTHLSNVDHSSATLLGQKLVQPDSGIATAALPGSDTAVDRFVRAVYYANFTAKADGPAAALRELSHIMNKFDRPKGASVYPVDKPSVLSQAAANVMGSPTDKPPAFLTEYTSWITLIDLARNTFLLRTYNSLGYVKFDLSTLSQKSTGPKIAPLSAFEGDESDADTILLSH